MPICSQGERFYHIRTEKGWYVKIFLGVRIFWFLCLKHVEYLKQKTHWLIKRVFYDQTWRNLIRIMLHYWWKLVCTLIYNLVIYWFPTKFLIGCSSTWCFIEREDKLNAGNRSVVDNFQAELAQEMCSLCNTVAASVSQQNEHLQCIEKFCHSFLDINDKVQIEFIVFSL